MKKVLKIVGIVLLIIIVILLIHTTRNYIIFTNINKKISKYKDIDNYNAKIITNFENGMTLTMDYYKKGNKQANILERHVNDEINKISTYDNGERVDTFIESTNSEKIAKLNNGSVMPISIINGLEFDTGNKFINFVLSGIAFVKSENCNGQDCYKCINLIAKSSSADGNTWIVNKETGLPVKSFNKESVVEREYSFNSVDDSVFTEPDIGQYKLVND